MEQEVDRRTEIWVGIGIGVVFFSVNSVAAWWFLERLHRENALLMGVPLLALGLIFAEAFVFRRISDRAATAFLCVGFLACLLALLFLSRLQNGY